MTTRFDFSRQQLVQLVDEYQELRDWTIFRDFANQAYGEGKVAFLEVSTHGEYNDEGGTDYSIESISATTLKGHVVDFDFSLPFWQEVLKGQDIPFEDLDPDNGMDYLYEWYPTTGEFPEWVRRDELPCNVHEGSDVTYDLFNPPLVAFSVVVN